MQSELGWHVLRVSARSDTPLTVEATELRKSLSDKMLIVDVRDQEELEQALMHLDGGTVDEPRGWASEHHALSISRIILHTFVCHPPPRKSLHLFPCIHISVYMRLDLAWILHWPQEAGHI